MSDIEDIKFTHRFVASGRYGEIRDKIINIDEKFIHIDVYNKILDIVRNNRKNNSNNKVKRYVQKIEDYASLYEIIMDFDIVHVSRVYTCIGCEYNSPKQLDHMDGPDGCLYTGYTDE